MQDIPMLDDTISRLPQDVLRDMGEQGKTDLFFFAREVLGFRDMVAHCHMPMTVFADSNPSQHKLMLAPRDHLKSSVWTVAGSLQRGVRDPNSRNLLANESATNVERMLQVIQRHCETNKVFRTLYSDVIPKDFKKVRWNQQEMDLRREIIDATPTFDTIGMTGAMTSRHYTHKTFDDVVSEEAVKSPKVMQDVITRLSAISAMSVNPAVDTEWFVGTRWAIWDVYKWLMKMRPEMAKFIVAAEKDGEPLWPERFPTRVLAQMRREMGDYRYSCLMLNRPRDETIQDLNTRDLRLWKWAKWGGEDVVVMHRLDGTTEHILPLSALDITVTVDLAPAEKINSDRNAVVVCGQTPWDEAIILDVWARRCTPLELMEHLFYVNQRFHPRVFGIEDVAYQKAFKYFLKAESERRFTYFNVQPIKATGKKELRIKGLQPLMASGRLYAMAEQLILREEMADFPLGQHDDTIDALSMHLQLFRGQLSPESRERSRAEQERAMRAIMYQRDPGARVTATGALVANTSEPDYDFEVEDDDDGSALPRYQNWEERDVA